MTEALNDISPSVLSADEDPQTDRPTEKQASKFDMLRPMIEAAYREMGELSKKKQGNYSGGWLSRTGGWVDLLGWCAVAVP